MTARETDYDVQKWSGKVTSHDHQPLALTSWTPDNGSAITLKSIVHVVHGMAEHSERYHPLGHYLAKRGVGVYGHDHRGHGRTVSMAGVAGSFSDQADGWERVIEDLDVVIRHIKERHPQAKICLAAHSMGSMLARHYLELYPQAVQGAIFTGTAGNPGFLGAIGQQVAQVEAKFRGRQTPSPLLNYLSFGQFNKAFKPNRTSFDWLSRDPDQVDLYTSDPLCGGVFSSGFFIDMLTGLRHINSEEHFQAIAKDLPLGFFSGEQDPVGGFKTQVEEVVKGYRDAGVHDVTVKFYSGGRHEVFNEMNRSEVFDDLYKWLVARQLADQPP